MPRDTSIKKVLMIGSGPIVIGQAAEFDYAGTQACRVLKDEGVETVLVNSNPATIMTDNAMADEIYLEALNEEVLERIIAKERPDGILASLGGQTGLTMAMQMDRDGILEKYGVRLLGTPVEGINKAEDRQMFVDTMKAIGQPVVPSDTASTLEEALETARLIGYPVIIRPAFTLGGTGGGIAENEEEFVTIASNGLAMSPITQILVEKCISGYKEIEFETMRDAEGNSVIVCSMENVDPVGVHTGDSVVVAPALTLTDAEMKTLMKASLDIVETLGIIGGCNCQFALHPENGEYAVIEVNPRVSRSSALASKATAYPIARITAKLALGYTLDEIGDIEGGHTLKGFEPAVDYIVLKFPKWPFDKFASSSRKLGTQMKATGEVMSIGPTFENALMKAVRGSEIGLETLSAPALDGRSVRERLYDCDDRRLFTIYEALKAGMSVQEIYEITKITPFFIRGIEHLKAIDEALEVRPTDDVVREARINGYTDSIIRKLSGREVLPPLKNSFQIVRTCENVFGIEKPYFYSAYGEEDESSPIERKKPVIVVLGSGPIRIGQGIEFDYSSVHCAWTLQDMGYEVVIINNNPETVSTDYDTSDRLYFEPLTPDDVMAVIETEKPVGVVVAFGGQTAVRLAMFLDRQGVRILGTSAEGIDMAEDRERFDELLESFSIRRPAGMGVNSLEEALEAANSLGYPVLLRPSYVIGGQNMTISRDDATTQAFMKTILSGGIDNPVLIDRYMPGIELEVDVISDGTDVLIPGIMEHIERAGVHSGDSIAVYPPYNLTDVFLRKICDVSEKLALALGTRGLVNIQYLIFENELYVIEVNPRASRTVPYISKVTGVNMVDIASRVMLGETLSELGCGTGLHPASPYCAVKVPVFSFEKLNDANSILGPEMKSTGEVLGIGKNIAEALFKGLSASGLKADRAMRGSGIFLSVEENDYQEILTLAKSFHDCGMKLYATSGTAEAIEKMGVTVMSVQNASESDEIVRLMHEGAISVVVYTGAVKDSTIGDFISLHRSAMALGIPVFTSLDTASAFARCILSGYEMSNVELVDINHMRRWKNKVRFSKMHSGGNDAIVIENFNNEMTCPESLCVDLCEDHYGIGSDSIVLIERSQKADVFMRTFNRDGSQGKMAGNNIRCVAKYLYDKGYIRNEKMTIETLSGIHHLKLFTRDGAVSSVEVDMGEVSYAAENVPVICDTDEMVQGQLKAGDETYTATCLSVGNPHCVVFCDGIDAIDLSVTGPLFENNEIFPDRVNTEFVRVVDPSTLRIRVWERGNGETLSCGTGAAAAAAASVRLGYCPEGRDILVKLPGGDMFARVEGKKVYLTGNAVTVFEGEFVY
ncbi:MAG: carbamoyl-phosphate synthase large subunit [Eubacteriales bacterium]|nr:carbamoyl-phosphate synthase large subunit [Eubacteriales bacterium]